MLMLVFDLNAEMYDFKFKYECILDYSLSFRFVSFCIDILLNKFH